MPRQLQREFWSLLAVVAWEGLGGCVGARAAFDRDAGSSFCHVWETFCFEHDACFFFYFVCVCNTVNYLFTTGILLHKSSKSDSQQSVPRGPRL